MTDAQIHETKEKILHAARTLFAIKGFDGASIREIAAEADVNIAAVNYHFTSKELLFMQVIEWVFSDTTNKIRARRAENPQEKVEDLAVWLFNFFLESSDILRSVFKMMLSEKGWGEDIECDKGDEKFGPPGGMAIAEAISNEVNHTISEADMFWAVKMIFCPVVHMALMYSNHFCNLPEDKFPYHDRKTLEADIRRLVRVVLKDL
ncbi:MAG: TetR/AcrR family transcriptional regulator [Bacteriovoracaceae bacterium]|nr:TetR/AcrR family transcriptional regulator [Bacteriovoracaceae bacterium]